MGWIIVNGNNIYGMYMDIKDAREIHQRVGGILMTSEQYAAWAEEQNEEIRKSALYYESDYGEV